MKKILILNGHPKKQSLCTALANAYHLGAQKAGHECKVLNLIDLEFDLILRTDRSKLKDLEPDIAKAQSALQEADHLVFVFPIWWGTYPALLKGFIDRVFLSGIAFRHRANSTKWDKLLTGKTARLITTMDTPKWFYTLFYKSFGLRAMRQGLLEYCGVSPVKSTMFSPVHTSAPEIRTKWLAQVGELGWKSI